MLNKVLILLYKNSSVDLLPLSDYCVKLYNKEWERSVAVMKITVFTDNSLMPSSTWYIETSKSRCLFASGSLDSFLNSPVKNGIDWTSLDHIILSPNCVDSIRDLQYLLLRNRTSHIYLPRESYQKYFSDLYHKLNGYGMSGKVPDWMARIVYAEESCEIGGHGWLFSWKDPVNFYHPTRQSLLLVEKGHTMLFAGSAISHQEIGDICQKAYLLTRQPVDYIFYSDQMEHVKYASLDPASLFCGYSSSRCVRDDVTFEQNTILQTGQSVTI